MGFKIIEYECDEDHIHILLEALPYHNLVEIVRNMKGKSSYIIRREFKSELQEQLWGNHLWTPSYFICTVSDNSRENVLNYIKNQKIK